MLGFLMSCLRGSRARPASSSLPRPFREDPAARSRMLDVDGMLRQASTRVSVDQLVKTGKKFIQVLSREKIDELINRSVRTILDKHRDTAAHLNAASAARIAADSKAEFEELLAQYQQTAEATRAVDQSKQKLEEDLAEAQFERLPAEPASEEGGTPLPGAFEELARELDRRILQAFKVRRLILDRTDSAEAVAELGLVEDVFRRVLAKVVGTERGRRAAAGEDPGEAATLRKRIGKFQAHIATMEAALKTLSTAKTFSNQQVQNLLRDLGLAQEDRNFEKKKEMLKVVLSANQGIRRKARELAARGISLDAPEERAVFTRVAEPEEQDLKRSSA